jgi:hypothetical protein
MSAWALECVRAVLTIISEFGGVTMRSLVELRSRKTGKTEDSIALSFKTAI